MTDWLKAFSRHETASVGVKCWGYDLGSPIFTDTSKKQIFLMASFQTKKILNEKKKTCSALNSWNMLLAAALKLSPIQYQSIPPRWQVHNLWGKCSQERNVWRELSAPPLCIRAFYNDLLVRSSCFTSHFNGSHNLRKCIQFNGHVNMQRAPCPLTHYVAEKEKKNALTLHFQPSPAAKSGKVNATLICSSQSLKKETGAGSWTAC